jgi:hypothetical protein
MKPLKILDGGTYNIIRKEGRKTTTFRSNLRGTEARTQLRHWKRLARNAGGRVFFEVVPTPADETATAQ